MPVLTATRAGVRHYHRWVFRDLDVSVEPGELAAVVGPPGSGRTTVLLALAQRFRLTTGTVTVDGRPALGYVPGVQEPEPVFTVAEHVRERRALLGRRGGAPADLLGLDPAAKGWELSPYRRQLLGLVLARLERPALIALDGVDDGLDAGERAALAQVLSGIASEGVAVVFTAREVDPAPGLTTIRLGGPATTVTPATAPMPMPAGRHAAQDQAHEERGGARGAAEGEKA